MNIAGVILGGGSGTRLQPLTRDRSKLAVPIAGKYRLVDIPLSNCIHSHIRRIYVLTQYNSVSLHEHIQASYKFDQFHRNFVHILAAQQTPKSESWYQGTADAVRQTFHYFMGEKPDHILILSGDQLYHMDFMDMMEQHEATGAGVTIATKPAERHEASGLGILEVNTDKQIVHFVEKPGDGPELDGLRAPLYEEERYLASMGIYLFNSEVLEAALDNDLEDFGRNIIPVAIKEHKVFSYIFDGYWKDIGTIRGFWEANLGLTDPTPAFSFYDARQPVFTHMRNLPPSKINRCDVERCLLSEGCIISGSRLLHSVVGVRAVVGEGSQIEDSVLMGSDHFDEEAGSSSSPPLGIGRNCTIRNAIIDKNARIGDGAHISPENYPDDVETETFTVRDGVIVIPKNTVIPPGTRI